MVTQLISVEDFLKAISAGDKFFSCGGTRGLIKKIEQTDELIIFSMKSRKSPKSKSASKDLELNAVIRQSMCEYAATHGGAMRQVMMLALVAETEQKHLERGGNIYEKEK